MGHSFYSLHEAAKLLDRLGEDGTPCVFILDYEGKRCLVQRLDETDPDELRFDFEGHGNVPAAPQTASVIMRPDPISFVSFRLAFDQVRDHLQEGNTYLCNLTFRTPVQLEVDLSAVFHAASARYKLWLRDTFVCFSPEPFVKISPDGIISSFPMKGTISADIENAAQIILDDPKETAEHYTIVDLIRNDLSIVASDVRVSKFRYIDKLKTSRGDLLQVSSEVSGSLSNNWSGHMGSIIEKLLPAGSISGAPKARTIEIIRDVEQVDRAYYTGIAGLFDGKSLNTCVLIRFIEQENGLFFYRSGGGITAMSDPEKEYEEYKAKIYVPIH